MSEKRICSDWIDAKPAVLVVHLDGVPHITANSDQIEAVVLSRVLSRVDAEIEAERQQWEREVIHGRPGGIVPTGILAVHEITSTDAPGWGVVTIDEGRERKRGAAMALQQEPWRRQGKRRGRR